MTYYLYDAKGYVTDIASGGGLDDLYRALSGTPLSRLAHDGHIEISASTLKLIDDFPEPSDPNVASTIAIIKEYASKCDEVLIISDGMSRDDENTMLPREAIIWQQQ